VTTVTILNDRYHWAKGCVQQWGSPYTQCGSTEQTGSLVTELSRHPLTDTVERVR
jgi:hypothetical protein